MIRRLLISRGDLDKTAVIERDKEVPYLELVNKALALRPLLPQAERRNIAIFLPNGGDYIAAFWAAIASGMTAFPLNVLMTRHEIFPLLKKTSVETVITSTIYRRLFEEITALEAPLLKIIYMEEIATALCEHGFADADIDPDEPMVLLNTSGTTETPKIVRLSERNVEASVLGYLDKLRHEETDYGNKRFILAVPFSSVYGLMILSACLMRSFPIVILERAFTLDALYRAAETHRVTNYEGSDSIILLMEQTIGKTIPYDIRSLTCFGFGGSKISGSTIEKLQIAYIGKEFFQGYGTTEASPLITKHPRARVEKTESVGTAIKGLEIAVEADNKIVHTPHTKGEIVVKGPSVMLGYYKNESETKQALKNGYLYTGDIGYLDEEGYLYICGRKKNIIIVRGFKVHPEEVEECIQNSQLVKDCIVYGRTDAFGDEMICADIVPIHAQIREEAIRRYCIEHLAGYKRPKKISFCESIKRNATGKTERRKESPL